MLKMSTRRLVGRFVGAFTVLVLIAVVAVQFVPYGRDHTNPPVLAEVEWDSARTRELAVKACYDCHSNETHWPWYSNVAPFSWQTQNNVDEGRDELNFSEWNRRQESDEIVEVVEEGEMPPWDYNLRFWSRISDSEKDELITGLRRTFDDGHE